MIIVIAIICYLHLDTISVTYTYVLSTLIHYDHCISSTLHVVNNIIVDFSNVALEAQTSAL